MEQLLQRYHQEMKRFLLALLFSLTLVCSFAQTYRYRSTEFAIKENTVYGWGSWSNWESSNVLITIDFDSDIVTIYSPVTQRLKAVDGPNEYTDSSGGSNVVFRCYDLVDDCWCELRLRVERNGNSQIYLTYSNIMYVYNVRKI